MTKSDLIRFVAEANNIPTQHAESLVNQVFGCIEGALQRGERVEIRALGSFTIRHYGSYKGRNPRTGTAVVVKPKRLPVFKANRSFVELLNPSVARTQDLPAVTEHGQRGQPGAALRTA